MPVFSLYDRFVNDGTVTEPKGVPDPRYALPSTVSWMRALALLVKDQGIDYAKARAAYSNVQRGSLTPRQENSVFESLLFGLHQLAALRAMASLAKQASVARVASVAWYYGVYAAATAMIAAQDGTVQDNHTKTARVWDRMFAHGGRALGPFAFRVSSLVEMAAKAEVDALRQGPALNLMTTPTNAREAHVAACAYLSGNVEWWADRAKEDVMETKEFKSLGVTDFRTKAARALRDARLSQQPISFVHQAIRFRGKANYREALYLAHGKSVESTISGFVADMADSFHSFLAMAGAFAFRRLGESLKEDFLTDLAQHLSFELNPRAVWG